MERTLLPFNKGTETRKGYLILGGKFALIAIGAAVLMTLAAQDAEAAVALATNNVNMRKRPGTNYPVITTIPGGSTVDVSRCDSKWCTVVWRGQTGYSIAKSFNLGGGAPPSAAGQDRSAGPLPAVVNPPPGATDIAGGPPRAVTSPPPDATAAAAPPAAPPPGYVYPPPPAYYPPPGYYYPPGYGPYYYGPVYGPSVGPYWRRP